MQNKFFYLSSDTTFKYLFKNENNRYIFNKLIGYYTGLDISNFHLIDNELSTGNSYVDFRCDVILTNKDESILINIECNREYKKYVELRNRRYLHTLAGNTSDNKHNDKRIVIQLNLNCYLKKDREELSKETFKLHDIENNTTIDDFVIHNVFIQKEEEICYNIDIKKVLQLFLCNNYEEMRKIVDGNRELKNIVDEIERLNKDKFFGGLYNIEEEQKRMEASAKESGYIEGHSDGLQEGRNIGIEEKTKELALKMLDEKIDKDTKKLFI